MVSEVARIVPITEETSRYPKNGYSEQQVLSKSSSQIDPRRERTGV